MGLYSDVVTLFNSDSGPVFTSVTTAGVVVSTPVTTPLSPIPGTTIYAGPGVDFSNLTNGVVSVLPATVGGTSPTITTGVQVYEQGNWYALTLTGSLSDANQSTAALTTGGILIKNFGGTAPAYAGKLLRVTVTLGGTTPTLTAINTFGAANRVPALVIQADARKAYPDNA